MSESEDYAGESEDYAIPSGETPETGDDVLGAEGALVMDIPAVRYPAGKKATARDADLLAANIKNGVTIFGELGTHAPLSGDNVTGAEGALEMSIPAANYPAGKKATAQDADLLAANIKNGVTIFGELGTHAPLTGDNVTGAEGALEMSIPAANYPAGKKATAQDADLLAGNIKNGVNIFGVPGTHAPLSGDNVTGAEGALEMSIPAANYPAGKTATAQDADLTAANIKKDVVVFGVTGSLESGGTAKGRFYPHETNDDGVLATGTWYKSYEYLSLGKDSGGSSRESGIIFKRVTIPQGAVITTAILSLYATWAGAVNNVNLKIHCNDVDSPTMPDNSTQFNALALTTGVEWHTVPAWTLYNWYNSPEIKTEIQSIIDREGWTFDNDLMIVIKDDGSTTNARRNPAPHEYAQGQYSGRLYIEWGV